MIASLPTLSANAIPFDEMAYGSGEVVRLIREHRDIAASLLRWGVEKGWTNTQTVIEKINEDNEVRIAMQIEDVLAEALRLTGCEGESAEEATFLARISLDGETRLELNLYNHVLCEAFLDELPHDLAVAVYKAWRVVGAMVPLASGEDYFASSWWLEGARDEALELTKGHDPEKIAGAIRNGEILLDGEFLNTDNDEACHVADQVEKLTRWVSPAWAVSEGEGESIGSSLVRTLWGWRSKPPQWYPEDDCDPMGYSAQIRFVRHAARVARRHERRGGEHIYKNNLLEFSTSEGDGNGLYGICLFLGFPWEHTAVRNKLGGVAERVAGQGFGDKLRVDDSKSTRPATCIEIPDLPK